MPTRIERLCHDKGLKMTEQRRVIAKVLSDSTDHPDVEQLYRRAATIDPRISIATVYRTIRLFEEAKIVERHDFGDGRARYEESGDRHHHHHLINLRTGEVVEFENDELEVLKRKIANQLGFELAGERLELYGVPLEDGGKSRGKGRG
ncbi:MAG: Fur family transcriptional regulator [Rhodospirillales bacterium]